MTLTLKTGHKYRTRGGDVVEIIDYRKDSINPKNWYLLGDNRYPYQANGNIDPFRVHHLEYDIVEEIPETKPDKVNVLLEALKFYANPDQYRTIDTPIGNGTTIKTPGLGYPSPYEAQKALKQWSEENE